MKEITGKPNSFSIGERDLRRVNLEVSVIISCFVSSAMSSGFSSCVTTADVSLLVSAAANGAHGDAMRGAYCIATNV